MDMAAAGGGEIERDAHDPADIGFAIVEAMARDAARRARRLPPSALVDAAHILAHRDDVGGGGDLGPDRARGAKLGQRLERGELAVEVEAAAKLVDEAVAAGAAEHRAALGEQIFRETGDFLRQAGAVDRLGGQADQPAFVKLELAVAVAGEQPEHAHRHRHDLDPDAFAKEHADMVDLAPDRRPRRARPAFPTGAGGAARRSWRQLVDGRHRAMHWRILGEILSASRRKAAVSLSAIMARGILPMALRGMAWIRTR